MAGYKLVDAGQLDGAVTATANSIRAKTGGTDSILWDMTSGFASAIDSIPAGGDTSAEDDIIARTISGAYTNARATSIASYAFAYCSNLTSVNFPACSSVGYYAFYGCCKLTSVSFPVCTYVAGNAFQGCSSLTSVNFPVCERIGNIAFSSCTNLIEASFPACISIDASAFVRCSNLASAIFPACISVGGSAFAYCSNLTTASFPCRNMSSYAFSACTKLVSLYLTGSSVCSLRGSNAFSRAGITSSTGAIYVPASLLASYQTATNWAYFSTQFVEI